MTSHSTSNLPKHEQHTTTKMSDCVFIFEAFHLCGHRKVTEKHAESCPSKGLKVFPEEGPPCDDYRREFHFHQARCDLCMVDANNPDMVTRDISGLYLTEKEIEEVRKGPTFQTHKEFCCAKAEPEDRRVELTPEQTLAEAQLCGSDSGTRTSENTAPKRRGVASTRKSVQNSTILMRRAATL
jgi:hypothetical protein